MSKVETKPAASREGMPVHKTSALRRQFRAIRVAPQNMMVGEATSELTGRPFPGAPTNKAMH
ncbi:MAG TPA: hypothetical protein VF449_08485 [Parvibaculum sp.]